jgi:signal transduction histidine kinase
MDPIDTSRALELIRSSRRTQIVGQLTAGVYHDFNNILTVILAQAGMMELSLAPEGNSRSQRSLDSIRGAAERGARLVRRLSEFRNRQPRGNGICDLDSTLQSIVAMMERLIGDDIAIHTDLGGLQSAVRADPALLEQSIVELLMNAREAMPSGGEIRVRTAATTRSGVSMAQFEISDTGPGLEEAVRIKMGEAGFSTRKGHPGLGIFIVKNFVSECGGDMEIVGQTGAGACIRLWIPMAPSVVT